METEKRKTEKRTHLDYCDVEGVERRTLGLADSYAVDPKVAALLAGPVGPRCDAATRRPAQSDGTTHFKVGA